jgi:uridine kinase
MLAGMTFYTSLARRIIAAKKSGRPLIVGINGDGGSGKSSLAANLVQSLRDTGFDAQGISIDSFHHPKAYRYRRGAMSPEGYYEDSMDYAAFADCLRTITTAKTFPCRYCSKSFDLETDTIDQQFTEVSAEGIIIAEGVFLFRPELQSFFDVKIFLKITEETVMQRVLERDLPLFGDEAGVRRSYEEKYFPAMRLYNKAVSPVALADIVIDNTDYLNPALVG